MRSGRPPILTEEVLESFLLQLRVLGTIKDACAAVGIQPKTLWSRRRRDHALAADIAGAMEAFHRNQAEE